MYLRYFPNAIVALCLICGIAIAQPDIVPLLLEVPAPPVPNETFGPGRDPDSPGFYSYKNPPTNDAPSDELLIYWKHWNKIEPGEAFTIVPSLRVSERLFSEIEDNPRLVKDYFNVLSHFRDAGHRIETIYDLDRRDQNVNRWNKELIKGWLRFNTGREIKNLRGNAEQVRDLRFGIAFETELKALAKVDWDLANPIVTKITRNKDQPKSQTLGRSLLYKNALQNGNNQIAKDQRKILMDIVEDRAAKPFNRNLALRTIASNGDFQGRDEWFFSLFEDESLMDLELSNKAFSGLTSFIKHSPPDRYLADMIRLSKVKNIHVRSAAVRNLFEIYELLQTDKTRALITLLPWLADKEWVSLDAGYRIKLVKMLQQQKIEKSVPGLLKILRETNAEVNRIERPPAGSSSYQIDRVKRESGRRRNQAYALRLEIVIALGNQRNLLAAKPLTDLLPAHRQFDRGTVVKAIHACHGFDGNYQVSALERKAREDIRFAEEDAEKEQALIAGFNSASGFPELSSEISPGSNPSFVSKTRGIGYGSGSFTDSFADGRGLSDYFVEPGSFDPREVFPLLQIAIIQQEEPDNAFLTALHNRHRQLKGREYLVSKSLLRYEREWTGPEFHSYLLKNAAYGVYETHSIIKLLASRKELRTRDSNGLARLRSSSAKGAKSLAGCISEDKTELLDIIDNGDIHSKGFLLACGRLIRANIPVLNAAPMLNTDNHLLKIAAARYLESRDTPDARISLYQFAADQAWLLGSRQYFGSFSETIANEHLLRELFLSTGIPASAISEDYFQRDWTELDFVEKKIKQRIESDVSLLGIYWYQQDVVLVYGDRIDYLFSDDPARYNLRELDPDEFRRFTNLLSAYEAADLPAMIGRCDECGDRQLIMSNRTGGKRILFASDRLSKFEAELKYVFGDFRRRNSELNYWSQEKVSGFEVIYAKDRTEIVKFYRQRNRNVAMVRDSELAIEIIGDIERLNDDDLENPAVSSEEANYRHKERVLKMPLEAISWFELSEDGLKERVQPPVGFTLENERMDELIDFQDFPTDVNANGSNFRATAEGLFRISRSGKQLIQTGSFSNPVINTNGDKLLLLETNKGLSSTLLLFDIRQNILNVISPPRGFRSLYPDRFYPRIGKFLVKADFQTDLDKVDLQKGEGFLLDPETLLLEPVAADTLELLEQEKSGLQDSDDSRKWAALERKDGTSIGKYNQVTLAFEEVLFVPWIGFRSDKMIVNGNEDGATVVYNGHLIRIPLKE